MAKAATKPKQAKAPVENTEDQEQGEGKVFTYVGGGEESPHSIHFMGKQRFVRGKATVVTDPAVLAKLYGHPTIVEGEVSPEELEEYDASAKAEADKVRLRDQAINTAAKKRNGKWAEKGDKDE